MQNLKVKKISFLGAEWDGLGITRSKDASTFVRQLTEALLISDPQGRALQRFRSYLNYYLGYAGKVAPIINTFILMTPITLREYWWYISVILKIDRLTFRNKINNIYKTWYTEASEYGLGAYDRESGRDFSLPASTNKILFNEAATSITPFTIFKNITGPSHRSANIFQLRIFLINSYFFL